MSNLADLGKTFKGVLIKGMEAIGSAANNIASNTKYKMDEMNIITRRREILGDFGAKAYELWQKGIRFPEELESQLQELSELDVRLNELRMQKLSNVENGATAQESAVPSIVVPEMPAVQENANDESEQQTVAGDAIDALFGESKVTVEMPEKIDETLDELEEGLKDFSDHLGKQIEDLSEKL